MKIIIIGNGFDLNLGLKTSYQDFIKSDFFISLTEKNNSLAIYLMNKTQLNNWVDIEQEITEYSLYMQVTDQDSKVKDDFEAFKTALTHYLKKAQNEDINQKSKAFEMIKNEIESADVIYNFNYTNSVFKVAEILGIDSNYIKSKHSYVHGSIEHSNIILGVEDKANVHPNHIFFKKSYSHYFAKSDIGKSLSPDNDLVLFGHSLGITDSSYFEEYFYSLTHGIRSPTLKFYYYGEVAYDDMMRVIDKYTLNNLSKFRYCNNFMAIDSSK